MRCSRCFFNFPGLHFSAADAAAAPEQPLKLVVVVAVFLGHHRELCFYVALRQEGERRGGGARVRGILLCREKILQIEKKIFVKPFGKKRK